MISSIKIAWIAGILEGEGCFGLQNHGKTPNITLRMTDYDTVYKARMILGGGSKISQQSYPEMNWKTSYSCIVIGKRAIEWMMTIYKFMGKRRKEKIKEIINVWKSNYVNSAFCKRGHIRTPYTTYTFIDSNGYHVRQCKICIRDRKRAS